MCAPTVVDSRVIVGTPTMQQARDVPGRLRFGIFEADLRPGELRKRGLRIRLQEQPFQVLAVLLARPGELVSREELQGRLWTADTFVDFDHGLNKAVNKIREALGDSAESPRFIETVARRGYRFLADVKVSSPATIAPPAPVEKPEPLPAEPLAPPAVAERHTWTWTVAASVVAVLATAGVVWGAPAAARAECAID